MEKAGLLSKSLLRREARSGSAPRPRSSASSSGHRARASFSALASMSPPFPLAVVAAAFGAGAAGSSVGLVVLGGLRESDRRATKLRVPYGAPRCTSREDVEAHLLTCREMCFTNLSNKRGMYIERGLKKISSQLLSH
ncbi:hypothetical protein COCNU_14G000510 [Cocos nucifera]|uniref:Uncharacterized protein n=1 Tax=Cocos nucifera TaxID=13894 RepID=A0A8K0IUB1_COCNU|nr:hypothetical protein COCNU_14G000510 [Cocos nucifera]